MLGDPSSSQCRSRTSRKTDMKLLLIIAAVLAVSFAEEAVEPKIEDSQAEAAVNIELMKQGSELKREASAYNTYVPNQNSWNNNYVEKTKPIQPVHTWQQPTNNYYNPQNNYPQNNYPQNNYPQNNYPQNTYPQAPQQDSWNNQPTTTTTQSTVIKNEQWLGDNGAYNYEYKLSDGTSVGEEGFYKGAVQKEENVVKKGWYSYPGADGKVYTVTWWADDSGFHAEGEHIPTPPPTPPAIQAALDKAEAEKNKPQNDYHPTAAPVHYPTPAPAWNPTPAPVWHPTPAPAWSPTPAPVWHPTPAPAWSPTPAPVWHPTPAPAWNPTPAPGYYPTQAPVHNNYPTQAPVQNHYYPNQQQQYYPPGNGK